MTCLSEGDNPDYTFGAILQNKFGLDTPQDAVMSNPENKRAITKRAENIWARGSDVFNDPEKLQAVF